LKNANAHRVHTAKICNSGIQRSAVMAKAQDTKKENKKKPAQTLKEKRKSKQEKKKDKP
jgi:hypothetical protein